MVQIAILGYGVVGSGVAQVLRRNAAHIEKKAGDAITVKRVLDLREFPGDPVSALLTHDFEDILNDPEIQIVAEVMGGLEPAYTFVKQSLLAGKHVCTSNKELVINHGAELLSIARERELNFMFEASVGGGIPIVRPMNLALTTDEVVAVAGILNGTTNYILTHMSAFGKTFAEALADAQRLGYAEKDPANDVEGYDACRKLAILLSLATGRQVDYREIETEGITGLHRADFDFARAFGHQIKLMVDGRVVPGGVEALTAPMLVHHQHPLSNVTDVFNGVLVQAKVTDNVMFFGRGAGKLPTAGAVVSDIVDVAKHLHRHIMHSWSREREPVLPLSGYVKRRMIRIAYEDKAKAFEAVNALYGSPEPVCELPGHPRQLTWLSAGETEKDSYERVKRLSASPGIAGVKSVLRLYEPVLLKNED
ncbi:MAG: homoserine dehydrogenase [Clostridiales bacterium]|jgi:homoserine dehydrogenase|nr:homoserine dehydrogenase [Clostridiales bacterium]